MFVNVCFTCYFRHKKKRALRLRISRFGHHPASVQSSDGEIQPFRWRPCVFSLKGFRVRAEAAIRSSAKTLKLNVYNISVYRGPKISNFGMAVSFHPDVCRLSKDERLLQFIASICWYIVALYIIYNSKTIKRRLGTVCVRLYRSN